MRSLGRDTTSPELEGVYKDWLDVCDGRREGETNSQCKGYGQENEHTHKKKREARGIVDGKMLDEKLAGTRQNGRVRLWCLLTLSAPAVPNYAAHASGWQDNRFIATADGRWEKVVKNSRE